MSLKIPAGPELNALVAEHVMDMPRDKMYYMAEGREWITTQLEDYSHDWNCIKPIAEKLRALKFELRTNMSADGYGATFMRDWYTGAISTLYVTSYADDLAHAVCLAALQAKGYKP